MLIRFFHHSTGKGDNAAEYLTKDEGRRNSPPEILEGDLARTVSLINSIDRKHTHTSGVISFAPGDNPSREELFEVIKDFKAHFFAGLEPDQFDITFVRHSHLDREEIHFLTPRMELLSGKALNIAPPTETHGFKEKFVQAWNFEKDWADPSDPERQRELSHPPTNEGHGYKLLAIREEIHAFLTDQIAIEKVIDRASMIEALESVGLKINRQGKDYISVKGEDGKPIRLKGRIYKQDWTFSDELDRANPTENTGKSGRSGGDDRLSVGAAWAQCFKYREKREAFNRAKYPRDAATFEHSTKVDLTHDSLLSDDPDHLFSISLEPELVPRPTDYRAPKPLADIEPSAWGGSDERPEQQHHHLAATRNDDAGLQPSEQTLHRNREVADVRADDARERAFEFARNATKDLKQFSARAEISAEANRDAAVENTGAASSLRKLVSDCVAACKNVVRSVSKAMKSFLGFDGVKAEKEAAPTSQHRDRGFEPTPDF